MLVYYRKDTGEVVYTGTTGLPKASKEYFEEMDWRMNLGPMGFSANDIETLEVEEDDPLVVATLINDVIEVDTLDPKNPKVKSKGKRPAPPVPQEVVDRKAAQDRVEAARKTGVKGMTPAQKDDLLEALLASTPPRIP